MAWLSLVPPLLTLIVILLTRRVLISLAAAVMLGAFIRTGLSLDGFIEAGRYLVGAVTQNAFTLLFLVFFGALAELIRIGGGIQGFVDISKRWIKTERGVFLATWASLPLTFYDSTFRLISIGSLLRPLVESFKGSKAKLAFILSLTSGQSIVLIPLATAYAGYMISLVQANFRETGAPAFTLFLQSLARNFYALAMLALALGVTLWGLGFGKLRLNLFSGKEEFTKVHQEREKFLETQPPEYPAQLWNLILPILTLLAASILFFWWTGQKRAASFWQALRAADFTLAIMAGALLALLVSMILFRLRGISFAELETHALEGGKTILPLLAILVLSWALSRVVRDLGFSRLIVSVVSAGAPRWAMPVLVFLVGAVISYLIGSSWATWAMVMPLAAALQAGGALDPALVIGAVWAGGVVGDSASPFSDNPIITSGILKTPVIDYISQATPYALAGIILAAAGYLLAGF